MTHQERYQTTVSIQGVVTLGPRHGGAVGLKLGKESNELGVLLNPTLLKSRVSYGTAQCFFFKSSNADDTLFKPVTIGLKEASHVIAPNDRMILFWWKIAF